MKLFLIIFITFVLILITGFIFPFKYNESLFDSTILTAITLPTPFEVTHIETPKSVKAIYMSNWVAGNKKMRDNLIRIIDTTELNAVVIDIKDYTGRIGFLVKNDELKKIGSAIDRIPDIKEFIDELHKKNIYVIGRISVFQDSYFVHKFPEYSVKTKAGLLWKDYKGVSWLDAGAKPVWEYIAKIGHESYSVGFDELNFDYIRFPSDGNMLDIAYPFSQNISRSETLKEFFKFINNEFNKKGIPISADLFGMTTSNTDDLGIGQILENALMYFDFVAPMVYPSHYPPNFNGWKNPSEMPYEIIQFSMSRAIARAKIASTTPNKLRPWLQDFSIGRTTYTSEMVKDQIQATYDVGLNSWMLWNASNVYTESALKSE